MAVNYPVTFGPLATDFGKQILSSTFGLARSNAIAQSPWTGAAQIAQFDYALWEAEIKTVLLNENDILAWQSFLISLQGSYGTFLMGDPDRPAPKGKISPSATVTVRQSTAARSSTVPVRVANTASTTDPSLLAGDYVQLGSGSTSRIYLLTADVTSSGTSFNANLQIQPPLKKSASVNDVVTITKCKGIFRLADDVVQWPSSNTKMSQISFTAIENIPATGII